MSVSPEPARPYVSVHLVLIQQDAQGQSHILLMKRENSFDHNGKYVFVAGKVDRNETPIQAMAREAQEEAGIVINQTDITPSLAIYRTAVHYKNEPVDVIEFFMVAYRYDGVPTIMEPDRCSDMAFYPLDALPDNISPSVATFLRETSSDYIEVVKESWDNYSALSFVSCADVLTKSR